MPHLQVRRGGWYLVAGGLGGWPGRPQAGWNAAAQLPHGARLHGVVQPCTALYCARTLLLSLSPTARLAAP